MLMAAIDEGWVAVRPACERRRAGARSRSDPGAQSAFLIGGSTERACRPCCGVCGVVARLRSRVVSRNIPVAQLPTPILYLVTVLIWGTSWYAMTLQLVLPGELAIAYRFVLAAAMLVGYCLVTGRSLRFSRRDHLFMALQGFFLFSLNYILFYWAADYLVSGLLAVLFSTITVMNIANGALLFRRRVEPKVALAALLGLIGIGLVFWPELAKVELSRAAAIGLVLSLVATYAASLGNMVTVRHSRALIPVVQANAIGMSYGALFTLAIVVARGVPFEFVWSVSFLSSLFYLALFASVIGFGAYLTLVERIGADRAAYSGVLFPIVALGVSTVVEDYQWTASAVIGVLLVLAGNLLVLARRRPPVPLATSPLPAAGASGN
jgi:drug/metabolite transporter (DMT)-like permease